MESQSIRPGSIVVGVDGSASADQAVLWAAEQAAMEKRTLTIVHSVGPMTTNERVWLEGAGIHREDVVEATHAQGREVLVKAVERVAWKEPDLTVQTVLSGDDPRQTLLDLSTEAAMLVVGSRGRGPVKSLLLGSVSVSVSKHASCPVVVVRPYHPGLVRRGVLVGVDASEQSQSVLEFGYREASLRGLPLTVLYCFLDTHGTPVGFGMVPDDLNGVDEHRLLVAEAIAGMTEKFPDVHVRTRLARGLADDALIATAEHMDLVVVGHHDTSFVDGLWVGSVATAVVEHCSCVVAVVPDHS